MRVVCGFVESTATHDASLLRRHTALQLGKHVKPGNREAWS